MSLKIECHSKWLCQVIWKRDFATACRIIDMSRRHNLWKRQRLCLAQYKVYWIKHNINVCFCELPLFQSPHAPAGMAGFGMLEITLQIKLSRRINLSLAEIQGFPYKPLLRIINLVVGSPINSVSVSRHYFRVPAPARMAGKLMLKRTLQGNSEQ